ncbi:MAG: hypothetical protein LH630_02665 [Actinomycetia bacterium]|nr:hypothetical protein [Actinomycetes bacterium]
MSRRAALPGANELFRTTSSSAALADVAEVDPQSPQAQSPGGDKPSTSGKALTQTSVNGGRTAHAGDRHSGPSGWQRHDEKITVYLSSDELVALDEAKATLYRDQGIKVDRGRIVREAVAVVVADLKAKGEASIVARRLREGLDR